MGFLASITTTALFYAATTYAFEYIAYLGTGPGNTTEILWSETTSVSFPIYYDGDLLPSEKAPRWSWIINVTQIQSPETVTGLNNATQEQTTYGFEFHSNGTSNSTSLHDQLALGEGAEGRGTNASQLCVTVVENYFPWNIINAFNVSDAAVGSCSSAVSATCQNAMRNAVVDSELDPSTGCRGVDIDFSKLDDCRTFFPEFEGNTYNLANIGLTNGSTFFHRGSPPYNYPNITYTQEEELRLQMMIYQSGNAWDILCARLRPEEVYEGAPGTYEGAASVFAASRWLFGLVALAAGFATL